MQLSRDAYAACTLVWPMCARCCMRAGDRSLAGTPLLHRSCPGPPCVTPVLLRCCCHTLHDDSTAAASRTATSNAAGYIMGCSCGGTLHRKRPAGPGCSIHRLWIDQPVAMPTSLEHPSAANQAGTPATKFHSPPGKSHFGTWSPTPHQQPQRRDQPSCCQPPSVFAATLPLANARRRPPKTSTHIDVLYLNGTQRGRTTLMPRL